MRVLALHPSGSSADDLQAALHDLDVGLRSKNDIELVYVDAPLSCSQTAPSGLLVEDANYGTGSTGIGATGTSIGNNGGVKGRCWFDAVPNKGRQPAVDTADTTSTCKSSPSTNAEQISFVGLDASILHLSQIWNRRVHSNPFSGIVAFGQSASIAALLPLLVRPVALDDGVCDDGGEDGNNNGQQEHGGTDDVGLAVRLFPGLDFLVLIDGFDITEGSKAKQGNDEDGENDQCSDAADNDDDSNATEPWFDDAAYAPESLHIISQVQVNEELCSDAPNSDWTRGSMSARLADRYGASAQIHRRIIMAKSSDDTSKTTCSQFNDIGVVQRLRKREMNVIGRFIVAQKNTASTRCMSANVSTSTSTTAPTAAQMVQTELMIRQMRERLAVLEEEAERALVEHVGANPPRALMAVIAPDSVGAWNGPKWRSPDMDGGGAPCPGEFRMREEARQANGNADGEGSGGKTANDQSSKILYERKEGVSKEKYAGGIGREHPSAAEVNSTEQ